jgi:hypothetical protein
MALEEATTPQQQKQGRPLTAEEYYERVGRESGKSDVRSVPEPRFDMKFVSDLAIASVVFAATVICVAIRVPYLSDPSVLLVGPIVGLVYAWKHRARR